MVGKILKGELFFLFILTVITFADFYYKGLLTDNFLEISSDLTSFNYFTYYIFSFVTLIGYFVGPWIFFPFLIFSIFYAFLFSKREFVFDTFNAIFLVPIFLGLSFIIYPSTLGNGIRILVTEFFTLLTLISTIVLFIALFLVGSFRSSFKHKLISVMKFIFRAPRLITENISGIKLINKFEGLSNIKSSISKIFDTKIPNFLRGTKKHTVEIEPEISKEEDVVTKIEEKKIFPQKQNQAPVKSIQNKLFKKKDLPTNYDDFIEGVIGKSKKKKHKNPDRAYFEQITNRIEEKLGEFKIDGVITDILKGPVVDTFLLELGKGVKVSKVTMLSNDLSGALYGAPIRIVYPMKGRTSVGIEVPRNPREIIYLDEVLSTDDFKRSTDSLPLAMGKDAYGQVFTVDLASMPHMLVAGATGAGKSVFINTLLVSLLVKKSPQQMKLILIDPKQLELALYSSLPHLSVPVVTDAKTASIALLWAVQEMERRYSILKELGVRNLDSFNKKIKTANSETKSKIAKFYEGREDVGYHLPFIVIVVDEFADLILTKAGKEIENNICRLAGKARAAGIHLIIATQRPSVDVITGLIKSNFPTRVSFRVTTSIDSRTILSAVGAEKLLGRGDMLYKRGVETSRVHSSYVEEDEIGALVSKLAEIETNFDKEAVEFLENGGEKDVDPYAFGSHLNTKDDFAGEDDLYCNAIDIVMEYRSASASMLQRRLRIGYNKAANLIEKMEEKGIVGPAQGSKPRAVLSQSES